MFCVDENLIRTWFMFIGQCSFMDCQLFEYLYIKQNKNWTEAQQYCRKNHTDLVTVTNMKDMERLINISKLMKSNDQPYIGLFRDNWRWSDGSSFSFRHWNKDFNNPESISDQCAMTDDGGRWKNDNCAERKPFICYDVTLIKENKTWEDALYYCRDHHHDLVTITNMDDQRWIQEKVRKASTGYVWMGLRYTCTLDFWFWVSDEVVRYKNWASGEPMDDCDMSGAMETGGKHLWRKKHDSEKFIFFCSKV
uniref:C-type lectin domain-containing protein n=1 Tax=Poecilia reticulata TaxID=8081 RepID=A0A3P9NP67_POERE